MNTAKSMLITPVISTRAPSAWRSLSMSFASASTRAPADEIPNSKKTLEITTTVRQKVKRPISDGSIQRPRIRLASNPKNIAPPCAEKSMLVWRVVWPRRTEKAEKSLLPIPGANACCSPVIAVACSSVKVLASGSASILNISAMRELTTQGRCRFQRRRRHRPGVTGVRLRRRAFYPPFVPQTQIKQAPKKKTIVGSAASMFVEEFLDKTVIEQLSP